MESAIKAMLPLLLELASNYPVLSVLIFAMGLLRVVFKPLMTLLQLVFDYTKTPKDNEWFDKVKASKIYKGVAFVLDYLASVKLPKEK